MSKKLSFHCYNPLSRWQFIIKFDKPACRNNREKLRPNTKIWKCGIANVERKVLAISYKVMNFLGFWACVQKHVILHRKYAWNITLQNLQLLNYNKFLIYEMCIKKYDCDYLPCLIKYVIGKLIVHDYGHASTFKLNYYNYLIFLLSFPVLAF